MNGKQQNFICKEHAGFKARIENVEGNVEKLWTKWDRMMWLVVATLIGVVVNLGILLFKV